MKEKYNLRYPDMDGKTILKRIENIRTRDVVCIERAKARDK
jgi:hypothetical protein